MSENYNGKTRDEVLESNIDMKMKSEIGSAIGYENAKKTAQEKGLLDSPDDIALASSNIQTQAGLLSASKKMKAEKDRAIADSQQENREKREAIAKTAIANEEGGIKGYKAQLNTEKALLQETENQLRKAQLSKAQSDGLFSRMFGVQQEKQDKIDSLMAERDSALSRIDKLNNAITSEANKIAQATPMETRNITDSDAVFNIADKVSNMDAYTFSLSSAQFAGTQSMGVANAIGGLTSVGYEGAKIAGQDRGKQLLDNTATFGNAQSIDTLAEDLKLSSNQRQMLANAGSPAERNRLFSLMTLGRGVSGFVGDKSFNVGFGGAGTTTSYMGSINSQISRAMGFVSNGGNGFDAMGYGAGGMSAMEGIAVASTAFNTGMTAINTISQIGRMGRGLMGGSEEVMPSITQADIGMSNITASSSIARKGAMDSISNLSRQIGVHQQYGNLPAGNSAWGRIPNKIGGNGEGGVTGGL